MSQLANIIKVVRDVPLDSEQQATLFFELLEALDWEVPGVYSTVDAQVFLELQ